MAASGGGTVRRVKQEARLRRTGQQQHLHATSAIAFPPDPTVMPPNQGAAMACNITVRLGICIFKSNNGDIRGTSVCATSFGLSYDVILF
jgi:hypothetical protein